MSGSRGIFFHLGPLLRSPWRTREPPESRATTSRESINLCLRHFLIFPFGRAEKDAGRARERASGIPTSAGISPCCSWHVEYFRGNSRYLRNCFVLPSREGANLILLSDSLGCSRRSRSRGLPVGMNNLPLYRRRRKTFLASIFRGNSMPSTRVGRAMEISEYLRQEC